MPSFDFICKKHGLFEVLHLPFAETRPCPECGDDSNQIWINAPNLDGTAASAWNGIGDPQTGYFTDKNKYHEAIYAQGRLINEPGMDQDALENEKRYVKKLEDNLKDAMRKRDQEYTLDEMRNKIKVDAKIHEATMKRDGNAIRAMGGLASVDEAAKQIENDRIVIRKA